jgi:hypothetical protein
MTSTAFFNLLQQMSILLAVITLGLGFLHLFTQKVEE